MKIRWLLFVIAIGWFSSHGFALDLTWTNPADGEWSMPDNWSPKQVPAPGDNVFIATLATIRLTQAVRVRDFTMQSGTLTGNYAFTVERDFLWSGGTIQGSASLNVLGDTRLFGSADRLTLERRKVTLRGKTTLECALYLAEGAMLANMETAQFDVLINPNASIGTAAATPFEQCEINNLGSFRIFPGVQPFLCAPVFRNRGNLEIVQRRVIFSERFVQEEGSLNLDGGEILDPSYLAINGGTLSGFGSVSGASIGSAFQPATLSGSFTFGALTLGRFGVLEVILGGTAEASFNKYTIRNSLYWFGGRVNVRFANGFETQVLSGDAFHFLFYGTAFTPQSPPIGTHVEVAGNAGSFFVGSVTPEMGPLFLGDFRPPALRMQFSEEPVAYHFSPAVMILDSNGRFNAPAGTPFGGATLTVRVNQFENTDLLDITNEGTVDEPLQIMRGDPIGITIRLGGTIIAEGAQIANSLAITFNQNANADSIQRVLRHVRYKNHRFIPEAFTTASTRFEDKVIEVVFRDGTGAEWLFNKTIQFPYLVGIECNGPRDLFYDEKGVIYIDGVFSDGSKAPVLQLETNFSDSGVGLEFNKTRPGLTEVSGRTGSASEHNILATAGPFFAEAPLTLWLPRPFEDVEPRGGYVLVRCAIGSVIRFTCTDDECEGAEAVADLTDLPVYYAAESLMKTSEEGSRLALLYRRHSSEVVEILQQDERLMWEAKATVLAFSGGLASLLGGKGSLITISQAFVDKLNNVWNGIREKAGVRLKYAMDQEQTRLNNFQTFVGKSYSQWSQILGLPVPDKPWIHASSGKFENGKFSVEANYVQGMEYSLLRSSTINGTWEEVPASLVVPNIYSVRLTDPDPKSSALFYKIRISSGVL
jgi:hypothetical protein